MNLLKLNQLFICMGWMIVIYSCSYVLSVLEEQTLNSLEVCTRHKPCQSTMNGTVVEEMCHEKGLKIHDRCCLNSTDTTVIIGINLRKCDITNISGLFHKLDYLRVIMLEENPIHNVSSADFVNVLHIDYLSLPANLTCPGGAKSWGNITIQENKTTCLHEVDICNSHNVSCPDHAHCECCSWINRMSLPPWLPWIQMFARRYISNSDVFHWTCGFHSSGVCIDVDHTKETCEKTRLAHQRCLHSK